MPYANVHFVLNVIHDHHKQLNWGSHMQASDTSVTLFSIRNMILIPCSFFNLYLVLPENSGYVLHGVIMIHGKLRLLLLHSEIYARMPDTSCFTTLSSSRAAN